ncbi:hypothetical protein D3C81_1058840 [compost metagenome]
MPDQTIKKALFIEISFLKFIIIRTGFYMRIVFISAVCGEDNGIQMILIIIRPMDNWIGVNQWG